MDYHNLLVFSFLGFLYCILLFNTCLSFYFVDALEVAKSAAGGGGIGNASVIIPTNESNLNNSSENNSQIADNSACAGPRNPFC